MSSLKLQDRFVEKYIKIQKKGDIIHLLRKWDMRSGVMCRQERKYVTLLEEPPWHSGR